MSRYYSYINSAKEIILSYNGAEPFASFLKKKFAENKKYGSKDRKQIAHLCYCFFRLGKMGRELKTEERILSGLFLCSDTPNEILEHVRPTWNDLTNLPVAEKCKLIDVSFSLTAIFPWHEKLSDSIVHKDFCYSFLIQPDLFLRLRPGYEDVVKEKLTKAGIEFKDLSSNSLALPNTSKIDSIIDLDKEAVVQDYNSQRTGDLLRSANGLSVPVRVWDSCAASGGKSIMAKDVLGKIDLTVSDIRETIVFNLKKRFAKAGISNYKSFVADLSKTNDQQSLLNYQLVIADVPCSGSGTWSRTPEQLYFFDEKKIKEYADLQRKIVSNIINRIQPGGYLLYITCSVFKEENEDAIDFICEKFQLQAIQIELLKGYEMKADTLFAALLQKPL